MLTNTYIKMASQRPIRTWNNNSEASWKAEILQSSGLDIDELGIAEDFDYISLVYQLKENFCGGDMKEL